MGFQNTINSAIGAVGAAAAFGRHMKQQSAQIKATEDQAAETKALKEQQAAEYKKQQDLQRAELKGTIANNEATLNEQDNYVETELQRRDSYVNDEFLFGNLSTDDKLKELEAYAGGDVVNAKKGVELERARIAMATVQGKMEARRQLKFDIDIAKKKLEMLGEQNG